MLYHYQNKELTSEAKNLVSEAKNLYYNYMCKKAPACQEKVNNFLKTLSESEKATMDFQYANLATDSAFSTLELINKLPTVPLVQFYEHQLEAYRDLCNQQKQYLILFNLCDTLKELQNQEQKDLVLRKLVVNGPHAAVLNQLLEAGANPLTKGAQSGLNAIDRAKQEKLDQLAIKLEEYAKKKGLTETVSNLSNSNSQHFSNKVVL